MRKPKPIRCPKCGHLEETTVCRFCQTDKLARFYPARDPITGMDEDERLDDPRHGQADYINRGGRS